jgi:type I restriction enzyme, S subunit
MLVEELIFQYEADLEDGWQAKFGIPEDWNIMKLADAVGQIDYGLSQSIPKSPPSNGIKIVSTADINREGDILYGKIRTTETSSKIIRRLTLCNGDVLFNWRNSAELIGKTGVFESQPEPHIFASFILRIDCTDSLIHNFFLKHLMRYYRERGIFIKLSRRAVNQANYNKNEISQLRIPVPSRTEQKKIAYVLSTVQRAIAQQEQLIQTTTELKKALMHKLFTKGLHGEKQKETEIGPVPESWKETTIGEVCDLQTGGTPSRQEPRYWNGDIPWIKTGEVDYCVITEAEEFITQAGLASSNTKLFPKGTLLIAMYGQGITRGKVAIIGIEAATNQACAAVTPKQPEELLINFIYYFLQYHYEELRNRGHGANQKNLSITLIKIFPLTYPLEVEEQREIIDIFQKLDEKLELARRKASALQDLFRTLLHQLMTAQIRVHDIDLPGFDESAEPLLHPSSLPKVLK